MLIYLLIGLVGLGLLIRRLALPPRSFAPGLPVIPIWVSFLPLVYGWLGIPLIGQDEVYERYIAPRIHQYGAVVIYFGSRWNVLIAHPEGIKQLFARERDLFVKSGNHKKIPEAAISQLTGGNIISEHGEAWRRYAGVIRPAMKDGLKLELLPMVADRFVDQLRLQSTLGFPVAVTPLVQRYAMDAACNCIFGRDLKFLVDPRPSVHSLHSLVKRHIFHPFFLTFPAFDAMPWLFPSRTLARDMIVRLERELLSVLPGREVQELLGVVREKVATTEESSMVMKGMNDALASGVWLEREYIDNMKILFIAGHENVQQALCSLLWVLAYDQGLQGLVRDEIHRTSSSADRPILHAVIHETLRLYPPIPQLFNRRVAEATILNFDQADGSTLQVPLQKDTYLGWTAFALHRSTRSTLWAPDHSAFRWERWGSSVDEIDAMARKARSRGQFITFHGGARACPGQPFATASLHASVARILTTFQLEPDSQWHEKLTPGGLLAPRDLKLVFKSL